MEIWRTIMGWGEAYEGSSCGRFRRGSRILAQTPAPNGYLTVNLSWSGKAVRQSSHALIAHLFLGHRPAGYQVAHMDGDKTNNAVSNLAYLTPAENNQQKHLHGTMYGGERHHAAKLTEADVAFIRANVKPGSSTEGYVAHAKRLGVTTGAVWRACNGGWSSNARSMERVR